MGVEYTMYNPRTKEYLNLGKSMRERGFQMEPELISRFVLTAVEPGSPAVLEIWRDDFGGPEDDGWKCVGDWSHDRSDPCTCEMCAPTVYPPEPCSVGDEQPDTPLK
jgi:hypothetical protein